MTERELREIKRRFRPDRSSIPRIVGCFVNGNKNIVARISQPLGLTESVVNEKLLGVMKKTLSGSLGTNLNDVHYTPSQVLDGERHKLLMALVKSRLADSDALERFYASVIESISLESNYVILLANDVYDVMSYRKDGSEGDSQEVFSYIVCAVCPVKTVSDAVTFRETDSLFHALGSSTLLSAPELGFMFPAFDDRRSNIYSALYYTRSVSENYPDFARNVLDSEPKMPPTAQRAAFGQCLASTLRGECSFEVIRSVHSQISEMVAAHKESREPEPLTISKETVREVLEGCGIAEDKLERLSESFDASFGASAELSPKNIVPVGKFDVVLPEVTIKVDPEHRDLVSTQIINNVKYVMIRVTGGVEVNGINIEIGDED